MLGVRRHLVVTVVALAAMALTSQALADSAPRQAPESASAWLPSLRPTGTRTVTVPRARIELADASCDAPPCTVTGSIAAFDGEKKIFDIWSGTDARAVAFTISEAHPFQSRARFSIYRRRLDFDESRLLTRLKSGPEIRLRASLTIVDAQMRSATLTPTVKLKRVLRKRPAKPPAPLTRVERVERAVVNSPQARSVGASYADCTPFGTASYDCKIHTALDVTSGSGRGARYRCTARFGKNEKVIVGRFVRQY